MYNLVSTLPQISSRVGHKPEYMRLPQKDLEKIVKLTMTKALQI